MPPAIRRTASPLYRLFNIFVLAVVIENTTFPDGHSVRLRHSKSAPRRPEMRLMIARLANIKVSTRIALVCLVPLCGLAAVSAANMYDALKRMQAAYDVSVAMDLARTAALTIDELQKERTMSALFVA